MLAVSLFYDQCLVYDFMIVVILLLPQLWILFCIATLNANYKTSVKAGFTVYMEIDETLGQY